MITKIAMIRDPSDVMEIYRLSRNSIALLMVLSFVNIRIRILRIGIGNR